MGRSHPKDVGGCVLLAERDGMAERWPWSSVAAAATGSEAERLGDRPFSLVMLRTPSTCSTTIARTPAATS